MRIRNLILESATDCEDEVRALQDGLSLGEPVLNHLAQAQVDLCPLLLVEANYIEDKVIEGLTVWLWVGSLPGNWQLGVEAQLLKHRFHGPFGQRFEQILDTFQPIRVQSWEGAHLWAITGQNPPRPCSSFPALLQTSMKLNY